MMTYMKVLLTAVVAYLIQAPLAQAHYPLGFTEAEIRRVHSQEFEAEGNKLWPISKQALNEVISWSEADSKIKLLYGEFKYLGDSKGYIHLGQRIDQDNYDQLYETLSDLNAYSELRMGQKPLFQDILAVDQNGRPQTSALISRSPSTGTMYAQVQVSTQGVNLKVDLQINLTETDEGLTLELFNFHPVRYGILGQIFGPRDFYLRVDFAAFDKGWLFRGVSKFNPSPFLASMIKDPSSLAYGGQMLQWLEPYIVEPLPQ